MAKHYAVEYANGFRQEFTRAQVHQAAQVVNHEGSRFFLAGAEVEAGVWFAAANAGRQAAWDKKSETHRRVRVLHGSSVAGYVEQWVRK